MTNINAKDDNNQHPDNKLTRRKFPKKGLKMKKCEKAISPVPRFGGGAPVSGCGLNYPQWLEFLLL